MDPCGDYYTDEALLAALPAMRIRYGLDMAPPPHTILPG